MNFRNPLKKEHVLVIVAIGFLILGLLMKIDSTMGKIDRAKDYDNVKNNMKKLKETNHEIP
jgi:hypothetical protein